MSGKRGILSEQEALLLLKLAAEVDAAQAQFTRVMKAINEKYGLQGNVLFSFANRTITQIPQEEEEGNAETDRVQLTGKTRSGAAQRTPSGAGG